MLNLFYAKARMYDADNRRFAAVDPVKGSVANPLTMVQYLYVVDSPLVWVDPLGNWYEAEGGDLHPQQPAADKVGRLAPQGELPNTESILQENLTSYVLVQGSQGSAVRTLQKLIISYGYLPAGEDDGIFGAKTEAAVISFQRDFGLLADGKVGPETWRALYSKVSIQIQTDFTVSTFNQEDIPTKQHLVKNNSYECVDFNVKKVQTNLKLLGYYTGNINGIYTSETKCAVHQFQQFYSDVPNTGEIDNITMQKIQSIINNMNSIPTILPAPTRSYSKRMDCSINFIETAYEGLGALGQIFSLAGKAGIGILSSKAIIATVATTGALTMGAGTVAVGLALAPAFIKACADIGIYGNLTVCAAILFAIDGGFIIGEASPEKPLGAVVWAFGYPYLAPLNH